MYHILTNTRQYGCALLAFKSVADPDTMYLHEAMREQDADQFRSATVKEVQDQLDPRTFALIHKKDIPKGKIILSTVWQMRRKRNIKTNQIKK